MDIREALTQAVEKVEKEQETVVTSENTNGLSTSGSDSGRDVGTTPSGNTAESNASGSVESTKTQTSASGGDGESGKKDVGSTDGVQKPDGSDTTADGQAKTADGTSDAKPPGDDNQKSGRTEAKDESGTGDSSGTRFRVDRPPQSWKGPAREAWNELPVATRQEIVRRERAFDSAMRESAGAREFAIGFQKLIEPYRERLISQGGGNEINAIKNLLEAERILHSGSQQQKAKAIANFVASYGVSIEELDKELSANPSATIAGTPLVETIRREIGQSLAPINQYISQQRVPVQQTPAPAQGLEAELMSMAKDSVNFEFLNDVLEDMADIMESYARRGVAITAAQAYTKAVKIHPDIGPQIEAREAEANRRALAKQLDEQAKKAKGASVSVSGAPLGKPTTQISGNPGDLRGTLLAAMSQVENGQGRI